MSLRPLFVVAFLGCLWPGRALAAGEPDADALIAQGIELREQGKDDEALPVFRQAYARQPSARAKAQIALAEQALGLWVVAETDLLTALSSDADPWIVRNRSALEGALTIIRRHLGNLEVRGADGAEVRLDGVLVTPSPGGHFRVEAGRRGLEVRKAGHHATARVIEVPAGGVARETVTLAPLPAEPAPPTSAKPVAAPAASREDPGRSQRLLGIVAAGTGGALVVTGVTGLLVRKSIIDDYNGACPGLGAAQPPDCDAKIDSARTWMTVSIVSFVAGGVLTAGGIALALTAPRAEKTAITRCLPALGLSQGGITCAMSF